MNENLSSPMEFVNVLNKVTMIISLLSGWIAEYQITFWLPYIQLLIDWRRYVQRA